MGDIYWNSKQIVEKNYKIAIAGLLIVAVAEFIVGDFNWNSKQIGEKNYKISIASPLILVAYEFTAAAI